MGVQRQVVSSTGDLRSSTRNLRLDLVDLSLILGLILFVGTLINLFCENRRLQRLEREEGGPNLEARARVGESIGYVIGAMLILQTSSVMITD